jgi:hypothetical protein
MSRREDFEQTHERAAKPGGAPEIKNETQSELPMFTSPPTSPGGEVPADNVVPPAIEIIALPEPPRFRFKMPELPRFRFKIPELARFRLALTRRHKRYASLAATVMLAAGVGGVIGATASGGIARTVPVDVAGQHERKAMQHTIARLSKEISALKASMAAANKASQSQIAKISDKIGSQASDKPAIVDKPVERATQQASPEITGSIPTPRPAPRQAAADSAQAEHPPVVKNWSIRSARNGYVYVQGRGDIYEVVPGAPLPGLGPVQSIKRQDGHWVVTTPKGIIVSARDRRYFE